MWNFTVQRGTAIASWLLALAAQVSGYSNVAIALFLIGLAIFFLLVPAWHHARNWHLRRVASGTHMGTPQILLLVGLAGAWLFLTMLIAGGAWLIVQSPARQVIVATSTDGIKNQSVWTGAQTANVSATSDPGPLIWFPQVGIEGGPPVGQNVFSLRFRGTNSSSNEVRLKSATIISAINGTKQAVEIAAQHEIVPIDQIELIPAGAPIELVAKFGPPDPNNPGKILGLDPKTFIETWRQFSLNVEDDTRSYRVLFGESELAPLFPGVIGPHVSKKAP